MAARRSGKASERFSRHRRCVCAILSTPPGESDVLSPSVRHSAMFFRSRPVFYFFPKHCKSQRRSTWNVLPWYTIHSTFIFLKCHRPSMPICSLIFSLYPSQTAAKDCEFKSGPLVACTFATRQDICKHHVLANVRHSCS